MVIIGDAPVHDTIVETEDEDGTVYHCHAPEGPFKGKEIGFEPTLCSAWSAPVKSLSELDEHLARANERLAARAKREQEDA